MVLTPLDEYKIKDWLWKYLRKCYELNPNLDPRSIYSAMLDHIDHNANYGENQVRLREIAADLYHADLPDGSYGNEYEEEAAAKVYEMELEEQFVDIINETNKIPPGKTVGVDIDKVCLHSLLFERKHRRSHQGTMRYPIIVAQGRDGTLYCIDGFGRLKEEKKRGKRKIRAHVLTLSSKIQALFLSLILNRGEPLTFLERGLIYRDLVQTYNMPRTVLLDFERENGVKLSKAGLSEAIATAELFNELKDKGKVNVDALYFAPMMKWQALLKVKRRAPQLLKDIIDLLPRHDSKTIRRIVDQRIKEELESEGKHTKPRKERKEKPTATTPALDFPPEIERFLNKLMEKMNVTRPELIKRIVIWWVEDRFKKTSGGGERT